jgi:hypothetical protein
MPRLGVNTLRWLLFVVNLAALGGLGYLSWNLFSAGARDQLRIGLPDPSEVAVSEEVRKTFDAKDLNQILRVHKDAPRAKAEPKPVETAPPPLVEGGPLSGWEVAVAIFAEEKWFASLQEKVQQNIVPNQPGQRTVAPPDPRGGRARPGASRPRQPVTRRAAPQTALRTKWVVEGHDFKIDGNSYQALRVSVAPSELEYRDQATGRVYKLSGAVNPWTGYDPGTRGAITLRGLTDEELGIDPTQNPLAAAQGAAAADERGEVKKAGDPAAPAAAPGAEPAAKPTPISREAAKNAAAVREDKNAEASREKLQEIERMQLPEEERKAIQEALQGAGEKPQ